MPPSSRLLYYDLGMYADDEGVVEAFTVMRQTNATEDDLRVLVSKGFVRILNEDLVTVIMDWDENNYIRSDRKRKSIYNNLLLEMSRCQSDVRQLSDTCQSDDSIGEDRIGKVSLGKGSSRSFTPPTLEEVRQYVKEKNLNIDPDYFFNYYDSDNWMKGNSRNSKKEPMKNWKQTAISWDKREKKRDKSEQPMDWSDFLGEEHGKERV